MDRVPGWKTVKELLVRTSLQIGIELGAQKLRVVWVVKRRGGRAEWRYQEQRRHEDMSPERLCRDLDHLLRPLRRWRFDGTVMLAAPQSTVRTLTVRVPTLVHLPRAVREALSTLLPFNVEQAHVVFRIRQQQPIDEELECSLSLAACELPTLQDDLEVLWQVGWAPSAVVPSALALVKAAKSLDALDQQPTVVIEIGTHRTTIVLVSNGEAVYARDIALGTSHVAEALQRHVSIGQVTLTLSADRAERLIQEVGIPHTALSTPTQDPLALSRTASAEPCVGEERIPATTYLGMIQPVLEQLVSELRRTMNFGVQAAAVAAPRRALVSGEGSQLPNWDRWLSEELGVPVSRLSCEQWLGAQGAAAAITCGLAMFDRTPALDLQPRSSRQRGAFVRIAGRLWRGMFAISLLIWLGAGSWTLRGLAVTRVVKAMEARWAALQPAVLLEQSLETHTQLIERLTSQEGVPVEWFRRLAHDFPLPIRLTQLSISAERRASMKGEVQEREQTPEASTSELTLWLERARLCEGVQLESTRRMELEGDLGEFSLSCHIP